MKIIATAILWTVPVIKWVGIVAFVIIALVAIVKDFPNSVIGLAGGLLIVGILAGLNALTKWAKRNQS